MSIWCHSYGKCSHAFPVFAALPLPCIMQAKEQKWGRLGTGRVVALFFTKWYFGIIYEGTTAPVLWRIGGDDAIWSLNLLGRHLVQSWNYLVPPFKFCAEHWLMQIQASIIMILDSGKFNHRVKKCLVWLHYCCRVPKSESSSLLWKPLQCLIDRHDSVLYLQARVLILQKWLEDGWNNGTVLRLMTT